MFWVDKIVTFSAFVYKKDKERFDDDDDDYIQFKVSIR